MIYPFNQFLTLIAGVCSHITGWDARCYLHDNSRIITVHFRYFRWI